MKIKTIVSITALTLYHMSFSNSYLGPQTFTNTKFGSLNVTGRTTLNNVTIVENAFIVGPLETNAAKIATLQLTGSLNAKKSILNSANIIGSSNLIDCKTLNLLSITGKLNARNTHLTNASIIGPTELEHCDLSSQLTVVGYLHCKNSKLNKVTITTSKAIVLHNSVIQSLHARKNNSGGGFFSWIFEWMGFATSDIQTVEVQLLNDSSIESITHDENVKVIIIK